jgi:hypothetical protein
VAEQNTTPSLRVSDILASVLNRDLLGMKEDYYRLARDVRCLNVILYSCFSV